MFAAGVGGATSAREHCNACLRSAPLRLGFPRPSRAKYTTNWNSESIPGLREAELHSSCRVGFTRAANQILGVPRASLELPAWLGADLSPSVEAIVLADHSPASFGVADPGGPCLAPSGCRTRSPPPGLVHLLDGVVVRLLEGAVDQDPNAAASMSSA